MSQAMAIGNTFRSMKLNQRTLSLPDEAKISETRIIATIVIIHK